MRILETGFTSPDSTQAMAVDAGLTPKTKPPQTKPPKPSPENQAQKKIDRVREVVNHHNNF